MTIVVFRKLYATTRTHTHTSELCIRRGRGRAGQREVVFGNGEAPVVHDRDGEHLNDQQEAAPGLHE